jgi:hypothetical protein
VESSGGTTDETTTPLTWAISRERRAKRSRKRMPISSTVSEREVVTRQSASSAAGSLAVARR